MPKSDHYEIYYSDKLWSLIPAMYRSEDAAALDGVGPLREIVNRIGVQGAILRRGIDRLWEDQSIESCDDWVIPYIADLLATNLVASLSGRGQRLDVAKTIYYRRRKGTVAILEEIASDITGWEARVVEFFRNMGRTRHGLDPAIGPTVERVYPDKIQKASGLVGAYSQTAMGGFADLRNTYGAEKAHSAFDEYFHFADVRLAQGQSGWHNIHKLGIFLWRLTSFPLDQTTPVEVKGCDDWYTFDPTGRDIPLFASASRRESKLYGDQWISPEEWQLPTPIGDGLWDARRATNEFIFRPLLYPADPLEDVRSLSVYTLPGVAGFVLADPANVDVYPERGRFHAKGPLAGQKVYGTYHYGFSAFVGAGSYDRRVRGEDDDLPLPVSAPITGGAVIAPNATGTTQIGDSLTYATPATVGPIATAAAIVSKNKKRPVIRMKPGDQWVFTGAPDSTLTLDGLLVTGGDIILRGQFQQVTLRSMTLDPGSSGAPAALFDKACDDERELRPVTLWVEGTVNSLVIERSITGPIRTRNNGILASLQARDSILQSLRTSAFGPLTAGDIKDPTSLAKELGGGHTPLTAFLLATFPAGAKAALSAYDPAAPPSAAIATSIVTALNAALAGPAIFTTQRFADVPLSPAVIALKNSNPAGAELARLNRLLLEEAFPHELADAAIAMADGVTSLTRVTVLGRMNIHELEASECILDEFVVTENPQRGCVRFSAWVTGSILPKRYESVEIGPAAPIFTSRKFGRPGYAQLSLIADRAVIAPEGGSILEGAQNGSEMGAFSSGKNAIKERSLRLKLEEFMPVGLAPVLVYVT
ncbi:MAG: hypothetical protein ABI759_28600 [Candidatus Solibacter sp.]